MRDVPQRIQKENVEILQLFQRCLRDAAVIRQVSRTAEAKAINLGFAMDHGDRLKARSEQLNQPLKSFEFNLSQSAELVVTVKDVTECAPNKIRRCRTCIERQFIRPVPIAQRAQIIKAQNMIGMTVGEDHSV